VMLTICYLTNRRNPRFHWFAASFSRQWEKAGRPQVKLVVVDFYAGMRGIDYSRQLPDITCIQTPPHPNPWQGSHRLTTRDYFAASVARNTGLLHADDGYIVYVDDLSVLLPGWLDSVLHAATNGYVACGAYAKVPRLEVEEGYLRSFASHTILDPSVASVATLAQNLHPVGFDNRWKHTPQDSFEPHPCDGNWLYGASCAIPVEALLTIGGWDHRLDAQGGEDYTCGLMLQRHGYLLRYCKQMMTLESEEAHAEDPPFLRVIKGAPNGPDERKNASWVHLNMILNDPRPTVPDIYGEGGIREWRKRVLAGGPLPVIQNPQHHWPDGQPLREM
jgi:hypothetical protein